MSFVHAVRIRYVDCDMQGVVYNAHYLTFADDALDTWLRELDSTFEGLGWELMVKRAEITWHGPARVTDVVAVDVSVARWGTTSLDVAFAGSVAEQPVFDGLLTYVVVDAEQHRPVPIPDELRRHLGG